MLYCAVLHCMVLYFMILCFIVLCHIVFYCVVVYCIVLYCVVLYCIVWYVKHTYIRRSLCETPGPRSRTSATTVWRARQKARLGSWGIWRSTGTSGFNRSALRVDCAPRKPMTFTLLSPSSCCIGMKVNGPFQQQHTSKGAGSRHGELVLLNFYLAGAHQEVLA